MPGPDLLSSQGLRLDGRRPNELRRIHCKLGVFTQPDGSAYLEQGNTKVLAAVYGPHQVRILYQSQSLVFPPIDCPSLPSANHLNTSLYLVMYVKF